MLHRRHVRPRTLDERDCSVSPKHEAALVGREASSLSQAGALVPVV
jgi:hypothetical protein